MKRSSDSELKEKVVVITGGCGVFGRAFGEVFIQEGAKVAVIDYKPGRCEECTVGMEKKTGGSVVCAEADVLDKDSLKDAKEKINEELGKVSVLINAAGGNDPNATTKSEILDKSNIEEFEDTFFGLNVESIKDVFNLNFMGTLLTSMVFAKDMLYKGGSIINISSMNSFRPLTKIPGYSAAKASVNNFTQWLAVHLAKADIRVNAIAPGFFLTAQNKFLIIDEETEELTERGNKIISNTPMGRFGEPEDLLGIVKYLASDESKFVTGVVIPVDGGFNSYSGV